MDAHDYAKLLVDPQRLAAMGALAASPRTVPELASLLGMREREAQRIVARLVGTGLVATSDGVCRLDVDALRAFASELTPVKGADPDMLRNLTKDEAEVAARFFRGRRLVEIPMPRRKRVAVLRRLVQEFEPGRRYPESAVNLILGLFHPDHAQLRRYMVDEGLLDRDPHDGMYWRGGGPVAIGDATGSESGDEGDNAEMSEEVVDEP